MAESTAARPARISWRLAFALAACAAVVVFSNGLTGDFVYDDRYEFVENELIQRPELLPRALLSDPWSFRATTAASVSPHWRPVKTLWMAAGFHVFGLRTTLGWHLANLGLHLAVLGLAAVVLRRLGAAPAVGAAILLLAAVHPTRAESVTWVGGFPDLLVGVFLLGALALILPPGGTLRAGRRLAAAVLFALAVLSKEPAIAFPGVVFVLGLEAPADGAPGPFAARLRAAALLTAPFLLAAAALLLARHALLPSLANIVEPRSILESGLTLPSQLAFYLVESVFPANVGPVHPLRIVRSGEAGLMNFWLPAAFVTAALAGIGALARRSPLGRVGLALFAFLLAPALPTFVLPPDRVVQDRYLYLPLLGLLAILLPALAEGLEKRARQGAERAQMLVLGLAVAAALPLGALTMRYNRAWASDAALWEWGTRSDPRSALALGRHASTLYDAGRFEEAEEFARRALEANPDEINGLHVSGRIAEAEGRVADAERHFTRLPEACPTFVECWDWAAAYFERQGRPGDAEAVLRRARDTLPYARASFTDSLALLVYRQGRREEALAELESVRGFAGAELRPAARLVLFHIGVLALELSRFDEGRRALAEFLRATDGTLDPELAARRERAAALLSSPTPAPGPPPGGPRERREAVR